MAKPPPGAHDRDALKVTDPRYTDPVKRDAMLASSPLARGAVTGRKYSEGRFGADTDLSEYLAELHTQANAVKGGDMTGLETMLATQANTLDMIFNQLARKAAFCEYLNQFQAHLALALKAQALCRATLEALAEMKNPRPLAFVKQANIANGPQQLNNGAAPEPRARGKSGEAANGLLTDDHGTTLDGGAAGKAGRSNPALEAVGKINGTGD
ncbi:hypothetical protein [Paraburkholderia tuberum]|uniref:hypothetical protein n=1 Tax=Paraburkholderia TaxID=1822464 RepID=UPI00037284B1